MSIGEKTTFWKLIASTDIECIEIPRIQRDYVQGRDTAQVKYARARLIDEMVTALENDESLDLNFVYGKVDDRVFIPIDGQQRLTTLFCLHVYAFSREGYKDELLLLNNKFKYSTRASTTRFLSTLLSHFLDFFTQEELDIIKYIEDASWYSPEWDKDPSINSFKVVLNVIHEKFGTIKDLSSKLLSNSCPVTFMSLKIEDIGLVNDLYIKMNSRGKPLTEFESFKSELFEFVDEYILPTDGFTASDFKQKADNEWLNMIWSLCDDPANECDAIYMSFLHQIIINRLVPSEYGNDNSEEWINLNSNDGFYNFSNYKPFLRDKVAIKDIFFTIELCRKLIDSRTNNTACELIKFLIKNAGKYDNKNKEPVRISTITKYAIQIDQQDWDVDKFFNWFRVLNNLINNTQIDKPERYKSACKSVLSTEEEMSRDINNYMISTNGSSISFFDSKQIEEEVLKCRLISDENQWVEPITKAESDPYFSGEIRFAFSLCGITLDNIPSDNLQAIQNFKDTWETICKLFSKNAKCNIVVEDNLFRRALLTYGDFSCWANSSYTFFFEEGKGYFNWRRMLRDENSFVVFARFFAGLKAETITCNADLENFLTRIIDNYNDMTNPLFYYIVKVPEIMQFMREKRFRTKDEYNNRDLFYSGARLSADYAEANTFIVFSLLDYDKEYHYGKGYLDSDTTFAYIEQVNGKNCHIEYSPEGWFCKQDGTAYLNSKGQPISAVSDMLSYIKANF